MLRGVVQGRATIRPPAAEDGRPRITVAKKFRAQFQSKLRTKAQRQQGVKLRVVLVIKDAAGNVTNAARTVTVKG